MRRKGGYVYIATNKSRTLYIGVTNDLERRMSEHKHKIGSKFTIKYNITRLVYYEAFDDIRDAIAREKQLKRWRRERKSELALNTSEGPGELRNLPGWTQETPRLRSTFAPLGMTW